MMSDMERKTPKLRYDLILIAAILGVCLVFLAVNLLTRVEGNYLEVTDHGILVATYSLEENGEYELGGGSNRLVIEDGVAYLTYADCPGQHCVKTGKILYVGQNIICAYNEIVITVRGEEPEVDLIS